MKIKAILFDLDNTLLDFMSMKRSATDKAAKAMIDKGLEGDPEKLGNELFDFYLEYGIESDDAFEKYLIETIGDAEPRILAAGVNAYLKQKYLNLKPYDGIVETLNELKKGYKIGLVTDGLRLKVWMRLIEAGIDGYFDTVVTFEDTGKKKPAPEPFLKACEELDVNADDCLFVGDWPERDIAGAKSVGMHTCLAVYGNNPNRGNGDYDIEKPGEILEIIKKI